MCLPDNYTSGISVVAVHLRYIYGFGGCDIQFNSAARERILKLDTLKGKDWEVSHVKGKSGFHYGLIALANA